MKKGYFALVTLGIFLLVFYGCGDSNSSKDLVEPEFNAETLSTDINNPYMTFTPGTTYIYEGETEDGTETTEVFVSYLTREVLEVECTVVVDRVFLDDELIEETFDWYAQDTEGNVWYMGEDSTEYEDGEIISTEGSWEAGVDGAEAGILIKANHVVGDSYYQEYYEGEAEDMAEVFALNVPVTLSDGTEYTCLQTKEWTALEPGIVEYKYYAENIGLVLEEKEDGSERAELKEITVDTSPDIDPNDFVDSVDNTYLPLTPGTTYFYEGQTEDGFEEIEIFVSHETKEVLGVTCTVVRDRAYLDGELIEETFDWFAQDEEGNMWYFGEDSREIEDGQVVSTEGSWEAGIDGAQPGVIMKAEPRVGDSYRQEYYAGEAEDMGAVVSLDQTVSVPYGNLEDCLQTLDWNPLEEDSIEYKYYAPNVGLILETSEDGSEPIELVNITVE
jgi:hypothetical protein